MIDYSIYDVKSDLLIECLDDSGTEWLCACFDLGKRGRANRGHCETRLNIGQNHLGYVLPARPNILRQNSRTGATFLFLVV